MIDIKLIQEDPAKVAAALEKKGYAFDFSAVLEKDALRRAKQTELEKARRSGTAFPQRSPNSKGRGNPSSPSLRRCARWATPSRRTSGK